jgi:uncharacterized membrane protein YkgB
MTRTNEAIGRAWRAVFTRDRVTSAVEILGAAAVIAGCLVLFGIGVALIVAGVLLIALGFLAGAA